jgi:hypothetical protein
MHDPNKTVIISIVASLLLSLGLISYRYIYPKKKINLFVLLILISLLPLLSLLRPGDYESGDFNIHLYRIISFYEALKEGIIMPSWASELNGTYGLPVFVFNYSLPYYFVSFFHFIGFSFITSMKIFLGATLFFSGIFMYLWIKYLTGNKLAAFTAAIFYLFSPYHLIDVHFRATPGESLIFTLLPLLFLFVTKYCKEKKILSLILIALFADLLFMSHPMLAVFLLGIIILYALFLISASRDIKSFLFILFSIIIGFLASIYVWLPFIIYEPYVYKIPPGVTLEFYPFNLLFYSPWRYGFLFQGHFGELAQIIGYSHVVILITSIILLIKNKVPGKLRMFYIFWVSLCLFFIFLMHPSSKFLWDLFPSFGLMMVPYGRQSLAISLCMALIATYFSIVFPNTLRKRKILYIIIIIAIGSTILNWGHRRVIPEIGDDYLRNNAWYSVHLTPYFMNPRWAPSQGYWFTKKPITSVEVINGKAEIKILKRETAKHIYVINAQTPITIKENTLYFPNWSLKSNDQYIPIYPGEKGIINAKLPKGIQYVELTYDDIPLYKIAKILSAGSLLILLLLIPFSLSFFKTRFSRDYK